MSEMNISDVIAEIPEECPSDEAIYAIETITLLDERRARVRVHLTHEFRLHLTLGNGRVAIDAEGRPTVECAPGGIVATLRRVIHDMDEAIEAGTYRQTPPDKEAGFIYDDDPPPSMDLPTWDTERGRWYDAEY